MDRMDNKVRCLMLQTAKLSTLAEYFDEEDPLDYSKRTEDIELPGDLYALQKKGATATYAFSICTADDSTDQDDEHISPFSHTQSCSVFLLHDTQRQAFHAQQSQTTLC